MDWDKLRIFHAVADAGSFTHAGTELLLWRSDQIRLESGSAGSRQQWRLGRRIVLEAGFFSL